MAQSAQETERDTAPGIAVEVGYGSTVWGTLTLDPETGHVRGEGKDPSALLRWWDEYSNLPLHRDQTPEQQLREMPHYVRSFLWARRVDQ